MRYPGCPLRRMVVALFCALALAGTVNAAPAAAKEKVPSAKSQLIKALKNLSRLKNYTVEASVLGGLSNNPEHKVVNVTVRESYGGNVFGTSRAPVMQIPKIKAYKTPKAGKGVIWDQGEWKRILTTQTGVKMDRLVDFPILILAEAAKYSSTARWLKEAEVPEGFNFGAPAASGAEDDDSDAGASKTKTVVKNGDGDVPLPRVLRVEAHPKKALDIWIKRVENSGCMREG